MLLGCVRLATLRPINNKDRPLIRKPGNALTNKSLVGGLGGTQNLDNNCLYKGLAIPKSTVYGRPLPTLGALSWLS